MSRHAATIFAVATPPGLGAVAVIRLSGPDSHRLVGDLLGAGTLPQPGRLARRELLSQGTGELVDEVMVALFREPNSYTGEDGAELHLHGNPLLLERVGALLLAAGAARAQPGEFTLRAFLNGKRDLAQAEAVHELVMAPNAAALRMAADQLAGGLGRRLEPLRQRLVALAAELDGELDFPDEIPGMADSELLRRLQELSTELGELADSLNRARAIREGIRVVLAGPPNAGKSSLFNALLGRPRALVDPEPGTTRDYLEEWLPGTELPVLLVDTAGLRSAGSAVEAEGVARSREQLRRADLTLWLVESNVDGGHLLRGPEGGTGSASGKGVDGTGAAAVMTVVSKADLLSESGRAGLSGEGVPLVSVATGEGIEWLRVELARRAAAALGGGRPLTVVMNERQQEAVRRAVSALAEALAGQPALPRDLSASLVREAIGHLDEVTGRRPVAAEELEHLFSHFCIGK